MRVLVVTAVPVERDAVTRAFRDGPEVVRAPGAELHRAGGVDVLAGGAGPASAAAAAAFGLASGPYDLVVSAGIGGGFAPGAPVGSLVVASAIVAADLGAETPDGFVPVTALGFGRERFEPPCGPGTGRGRRDRSGHRRHPHRLHRDRQRRRAAALRGAHPDAVAEAMEGFGVAEAADRLRVPVLEIRAVSNAVGPRDRDAWRIGDALAALTGAFGKLTPVLEGWTHHDRLD